MNVKVGDLVRWTNTDEEDMGIVTKVVSSTSIGGYLVIVRWASSPEDNAWYDTHDTYMELFQ
tara:strand:- start:411 stop:596 length:186 start_codon:yes stop_codon:yes gene_type:complete